MNAAVVCLLGLGAFALGYRFYSRMLGSRVFQLHASEPVPSIEQADGRDFVATPRHVLFGHHYASIAGAAPIIGPAIAVVWGWVPALLWVVGGTVFMGAVHDFSILVLSVRHRGASIGNITASVIGPRTRTLFLLVILFLVFLVIAVFAKAIASLFVSKPGTVIPINFEIIVALGIGWWAHKKRGSLLWPSVGALVALYAMVIVGVYVPVSLSSVFGGHEKTAWVAMLLVYAFAASVLPVWVLLHPRDLINSHQLLVGLSCLILGILIGQPTIEAPAFVSQPEGSPPIFPFVFVTIACGAISGFHGLVASGTTSKQLAFAPDARVIGYGGMLGEGTLALVSTLAVSAGLANWAEHYPSWQVAAGSGVKNFVEGAATFLTYLHIPRGPGEIVVAVLVISFAATSLDTAVRIQRYVLGELGEAWGLKALGRPWVGGGIAVTVPFALYLSGGDGILWPLFGTSNQLLAGLSLVVVTVWLYKKGRPWLYTGVPMIFVLVVAGLAMTNDLRRYVSDGNLLAAFFGAVILALEVWLVVEGALAVRRHRAVRA